MSQRLALFALLILSLSACSTTPTAEPVKPTISAEIRAACEPLPELRVELGQDMRQALLQNRAESVAVHDTCAARHRGALRAVGVEPITGPRIDRWAEFQEALRAASVNPTPTEKGKAP